MCALNPPFNSHSDLYPQGQEEGGGGGLRGSALSPTTPALGLRSTILSKTASAELPRSFRGIPPAFPQPLPRLPRFQPSPPSYPSFCFRRGFRGASAVRIPASAEKCFRAANSLPCERVATFKTESATPELCRAKSIEIPFGNKKTYSYGDGQPSRCHNLYGEPG